MMSKDSKITNGVMLNAYPDSIGTNLNDMVTMLKMPQFKNVFSLFYVLPTFFNSDLDRGFSIIDYDLNKDLVSQKDLKALEKLGLQLKFDIVLNHLSVASPQFKDFIVEAVKYVGTFLKRTCHGLFLVLRLTTGDDQFVACLIDVARLLAFGHDTRA